MTTQTNDQHPVTPEQRQLLTAAKGFAAVCAEMVRNGAADLLLAGLSCHAAEALAELLTAAGRPDTAELVITGHARSDACADAHCLCAHRTACPAELPTGRA